jgi:hypothetical protein
VRRRLPGKKLFVAAGLALWLTVGVAGLSLANVAPDECTRSQRVIEKVPELRVLCLSGDGVPSGLPDSATGNLRGWLVATVAVGGVAVAGAAGALLRYRHSLRPVA